VFGIPNPQGGNHVVGRTLLMAATIPLNPALGFSVQCREWGVPAQPRQRSQSPAFSMLR
jgi:hypothetical protein